MLHCCRYVLGESNISSRIAGLVLLASAPPAGNGSLVGRTMRRRPLFSIRLTWSVSTLSTLNYQLFFGFLASTESFPPAPHARLVVGAVSLV